jgi:hypothetical protein
MPRYFLAKQYWIVESFDNAIPHLKNITDFREETVVDHVPAKVAQQAPHLVRYHGRAAGGVVRLISYRNNDTILDVQADGWALLASSDVDLPDWRLYINGQRQPPVTVNGAFVGCFVPPGRSRVVLRYRPEAFEDGARITAGGIILIALLAAVRGFHRARHNRAP